MKNCGRCWSTRARWLSVPGVLVLLMACRATPNPQAPAAEPPDLARADSHRPGISQASPPEGTRLGSPLNEEFGAGSALPLERAQAPAAERAALPSPAAAPPPSSQYKGVPLKSFHLVVIGSSTAAGIGASDDAHGWVNLLTKALEARSAVPLTIDNLAEGGITALDLMPNTEFAGNVDAALARRPDLIVLALAGSNDLAAGTTASEYLARIKFLVDRARAQTVPVFVFSTAPKNIALEDRSTLGQWRTLLRYQFQECWAPGRSGSYSPCFIDVFSALSDGSLGLASSVDSGDGVHPNDAGHARIQQQALRAIEPYLCSVTQCKSAPTPPRVP